MADVLTADDQTAYDPYGGTSAEPAPFDPYTNTWRRDQIVALYQTYLGRTPSEAELLGWYNSGLGVGDIDRAIQGSPEAQAYTSQQPAPAPSGEPPPAPTGTPTGTAAAPTAPSDWQAWFGSLTSGRPPSPDSLVALEPTLNQYGVKVLRNASGIAGKIQLPSGQIVDVGRSFSSGDPGQYGWQWLIGGGPARSTQPVPGEFAAGPIIPQELMAPLLAPWTESFNFRPFEPGPAFQPPSAEAIFEDPGLQARLHEGQRAIERAASAGGRLNTGGTLRAVMGLGQDLASQEYANVYGRRANEYDRAYAQRLGDYTRDYTQMLEDYERRYNMSLANQDRPFNKLSALAGLGQVTSPMLNTASAIPNLYTQGAGAYGDWLTSAAAARAAGRVGAANASPWGSIGQNLLASWALSRPGVY